MTPSALTVGDPSYRTIKGILVAGTAAPDAPDATAGGTGDSGQVPAFLHGPDRLFPDPHPDPPAPADPALGGVLVGPITTAGTATAHLLVPTGGIDPVARS